MVQKKRFGKEPSDIFDTNSMNTENEFQNLL